ncbi:hypothetical protein [Tumebacillus permanentifrigoris]|uniref:Uncharacterized protein n=1 Tax=Tumebacillus permanentifrigoris TaxID=378543 RepID=A0A316DEP2_9BACL|nr:hypothetical protein [Tumebacillus permanentifrigoris]PWK16435.1 hypothetical protein C7459_101299 [Tumebacillus permanentifrigoris]
MNNNLAQLSDEQTRRIDQLEAELGVVLIAYDGYKQENEQGEPRA